MRTAIFLSAVMFVACGRGYSKAKPDEPVEPPAAAIDTTGFYSLAGRLTLDSCSNPSMAHDDFKYYGEWMIVVVADEHLFMENSFTFSSLDGGFHFTREETGAAVWSECDVANSYVVDLLHDDWGFEGVMDLAHVMPECVGAAEFNCNRRWELTGTKIVD